MKVAVVFDMPVSEEELWRYIATVRVKQFAFDVDGSVFAYATPREYTNCRLTAVPKPSTMDVMSGEYAKGFFSGWNACLEEMEKC